MIRDALNPPGKSPHDKLPNYDGSNREVQPKKDRIVYFYDKDIGCTPAAIKTSEFQGHWEKVIDK